MSDHKRCKACGRIEDVETRYEHEGRMTNERLQRWLREKIDPSAVVLESKGQPDHGAVLYTRERPTYEGRTPEYIVHQWATAYTDGSPVKGGIMFWSGGYWIELASAQADYRERSAR